MKKLQRKENMQKANQLIENLYIQNKEGLKEDYDYEQKPIGKEGIAKMVGELIKKRERLIADRTKINAEIKMLDSQIKKWEKEISPNQITMFGDVNENEQPWESISLTKGDLYYEPQKKSTYKILDLSPNSNKVKLELQSPFIKDTEVYDENINVFKKQIYDNKLSKK